MAYLPHALTELAFRQAIGRVVRSDGFDDDTRAYAVMPAFATLDRYARRVEEEMSSSARGGEEIKSKRCPVCATENALGAGECEGCGHEFPIRATRFVPCDACGGLNPTGSATCQHCGTLFGHVFTLTLDGALRAGAIVRGMEVDEAEVCDGERIAARVRDVVLRSGDTALVKVV